MERFDIREQKAVEQVIGTGELSRFFCDFRGGKHVQAFEQEFADYLGVEHAISVSNGTVALEVALASLGLKKGDEVITTPLSVHHDEFTLVRIDGVVQMVRIGDLVDKYALDKNMDIIPVDNIDVVAMNKNGKAVWRKVYSLIRHRNSESLLKLRTRQNRTIRVSGSHSVFTYTKDAMRPVAASSLNKGDSIVVFRNLPSFGNISQIIPSYLFLEGTASYQNVPANVFGLLSSIKHCHLKAYKHRRYLPVRIVRQHPEIVHLLKKCKIKVGSKRKFVPKSVIITKDVMELFGLYLAEGFLSQHRKRLAFSFGKHEQMLIQKTRAFLRQINPSARIYMRNNHESSVNIETNDTFLYDFFCYMNMGKYSHEKRLPLIAFNSGKKMRAALLKGYLAGDGCLRIKYYSGKLSSQWSFATVSDELYHGLDYLFMSLGISIGFYKQKTPSRSLICSGQTVLLKESLANRGYIGNLVDIQKFASIADIDLPVNPERKHRYAPFSKTKAIGVSASNYSIQEKTETKSSSYIYDLSVDYDENFIVNGVLAHNTFIATASAILRCGAKPVFVDIDPETLNMDEYLVEDCITRKTKAIISVSLLGMPAEASVLRKIADDNGLFLVEDAAQSLGAVDAKKKIGAWGDLGTFSFQETKTITTLGEGGIIVTNDCTMADICRHIRNHGNVYGYMSLNVPCTNARMTETQAAFGRIQLQKLEEFNHIQKVNALTLIKHLNAPLKCVYPPWTRNYSNYYLIPFTLEQDSPYTREEFIQKCKDVNISQGLPGQNIGYYKKLVPEAPAFKKYIRKKNWTNAEWARDNILIFDIHRWNKTKRNMEQYSQIINDILHV